MAVHPELIRQFCTQSIENGVLAATFVQARLDLFRDWENENDTMKRDQIWSTLKALEKVWGIMQGFSMGAPQVDEPH